MYFSRKLDGKFYANHSLESVALTKWRAQLGFKKSQERWRELCEKMEREARLVRSLQEALALRQGQKLTEKAASFGALLVQSQWRRKGGLRKLKVLRGRKAIEVIRAYVVRYVAKKRLEKAIALAQKAARRQKALRERRRRERLLKAAIRAQAAYRQTRAKTEALRRRALRRTAAFMYRVATAFAKATLSQRYALPRVAATAIQRRWRRRQRRLQTLQLRHHHHRARFMSNTSASSRNNNNEVRGDVANSTSAWERRRASLTRQHASQAEEASRIANIHKTHEGPSNSLHHLTAIQSLTISGMSSPTTANQILSDNVLKFFPEVEDYKENDDDLLTQELGVSNSLQLQHERKPEARDLLVAVEETQKCAASKPTPTKVKATVDAPPIITKEKTRSPALKRKKVPVDGSKRQAAHGTKKRRGQPSPVPSKQRKKVDKIGAVPQKSPAKESPFSVKVLAADEKEEDQSLFSDEEEDIDDRKSSADLAEEPDRDDDEDESDDANEPAFVVPKMFASIDDAAVKALDEHRCQQLKQSRLFIDNARSLAQEKRREARAQADRRNRRRPSFGVAHTRRASFELKTAEPPPTSQQQPSEAQTNKQQPPKQPQHKNRPTPPSEPSKIRNMRRGSPLRGGRRLSSTDAGQPSSKTQRPGASRSSPFEEKSKARPKALADNLPTAQPPPFCDDSMSVITSSVLEASVLAPSDHRKFAGLDESVVDASSACEHCMPTQTDLDESVAEASSIARRDRIAAEPSFIESVAETTSIALRDRIAAEPSFAGLDESVAEASSIAVPIAAEPSFASLDESVAEASSIGGSSPPKPLASYGSVAEVASISSIGSSSVVHRSLKRPHHMKQSREPTLPELKDSESTFATEATVTTGSSGIVPSPPRPLSEEDADEVVSDDDYADEDFEEEEN